MPSEKEPTLLKDHDLIPDVGRELQRKNFCHRNCVPKFYSTKLSRRTNYGVKKHESYYYREAKRQFVFEKSSKKITV